MKIFPEDAVGRRFSIEANARGIPDTDDTSDIIPGDSRERSFATIHCGSWPRKMKLKPSSPPHPTKMFQPFSDGKIKLWKTKKLIEWRRYCKTQVTWQDPVDEKVSVYHGVAKLRSHEGQNSMCHVGCTFIAQMACAINWKDVNFYCRPPPFSRCIILLFKG